jgi:hypothetical protein
LTDASVEDIVGYGVGGWGSQFREGKKGGVGLFLAKEPLFSAGRKKILKSWLILVTLGLRRCDMLKKSFKIAVWGRFKGS